jgi:alpha-tubulin suppressor-like RCC1 family protein
MALLIRHLLACGFVLATVHSFLACSSDKGGPTGSGAGTDGSPDAPAQPDVDGGAAANRLGAVAVTSGQQFSCALFGTGDVYCWGSDDPGTLGDGKSDGGSSSAVRVIGLAGPATAISSGAIQTCAIVNSPGGTAVVQCWGGGGVGELGDGRSTASSTPVTVTGLPAGSTVTSLACGSVHACAVADGDVYCWGWDKFDQLGTVLPPADSGTPDSAVAIKVPGLSGVRAVASSSQSETTCAITNAGAVLCWGSDGGGQLGDGKDASSPTPVPVPSLSSATTALSIGGRAACALGGDDAAPTTLRCWGDGTDGELGQSGDTHSTLPELTAAGDAPFKSVSVAWHTGCAVATSGQLLCWGDNSVGELGDGTRAFRPDPTPLQAFDASVDAVATGFWHTCAIAGGHVYCWGRNSYGEVGDGTESPLDIDASIRPTPLLVLGLP